MAKIFDISGRGPSNQKLLIAGLVMIVVSAIIAMLLVAKSQGRLENYTRVTADLNNVGDGLPARSDVRYHGLLVGTTTKVTPAQFGEPNFVDIDLIGDYAKDIPNTVTARVVPSNVFAVSSVELVDNGDAPALQTGDHIKEDTELPTVLFQTTISKLRDILFATGRDRTDDTLGILAAVKAVTHDRGNRLLTAGAQLDRIVSQLNATVAPDADSPSMLSALVGAAEGLQQTAPDLLDALHNAVVPMQVLVEQRGNLDAMLSSGASTLNNTQAAFNNHTDRMITIGRNLTPVMGVLADTSHNWVPGFQKMKKFSEKFFEGWLPDVDSFNLRANLALTPTYSYTRADCPAYGELKGPSCYTAPLIAVRPDLPEVLLPQNYQPPKDLMPPPGTVLGDNGNLHAVGPPLILPDGPNLVDPNPPLELGIGTGILGTNGPPMTPAPPVPGTANPLLTVTPVPPVPGSPAAPVAPFRPDHMPGVLPPGGPNYPGAPPPAPAAPPPAPAAGPGALPAEAAPASYGGNVGPIGSQLERDQLSYITGAPATTATQLLMAPVVRGMTVSPGEGA
ncbi:MAG: MCE family protein [Mycobacterium sp.]|nr:MCE family protein [Mycobacterium sp.]